LDVGAVPPSISTSDALPVVRGCCDPDASAEKRKARRHPPGLPDRASARLVSWAAARPRFGLQP